MSQKQQFPGHIFKFSHDSMSFNKLEPIAIYTLLMHLSLKQMFQLFSIWTNIFTTSPHKFSEKIYISLEKVRTLILMLNDGHAEVRTGSTSATSALAPSAPLVVQLTICCTSSFTRCQFTPTYPREWSRALLKCTLVDGAETQSHFSCGSSPQVCNPSRTV